MHRLVTARSPEPAPAARPSRLETLRAVIEHAAESLPAQGPITVFIHHNTLHSLEDLPFEQAVTRAADVFGCQPYLAEDAYRGHLERGRINIEDLMAALGEDLDSSASQLVAGLASRLEIRMAMLTHPVRVAPPAELRWFVAETDALKRFGPGVPAGSRCRMLDAMRGWVARMHAQSEGSHVTRDQADARMNETMSDRLAELRRGIPREHDDSAWEALTLQALWRLSRRGAHSAAARSTSRGSVGRHRDPLLAATGHDSDLFVNELLTRFCAAFLDQGFSAWQLPKRSAGLWRSFVALHGRRGRPAARWCRGLAAELQRIDRAEQGPLESIAESLRLLGVPEAQWPAFVTSTLLSLRGWAGMIWQMERRQDEFRVPAPPGSLTEFLAVRLVLDRLAVLHIAREELNYRGSTVDVRQFARWAQRKRECPSDESRAFVLFQVAQSLGWSPIDLVRLNKGQWTDLFRELDEFTDLERRRLWHAAYERHYRLQTLDALTVHRPRPARVPARFQVITCIDEREESFRRHLEEVAPEVETFGAAGFFGVAMYYRGAASAHYVPLCPAVIRPRHWVVEAVPEALSDVERSRADARRRLGTIWHGIERWSREGILGALITAGLGSLAAVPLVARVLFPRLTARLRQSAGHFVRTPGSTQLQLHRSEPAQCDHGHELGFRECEMVDIAERLLRDIGLTKSLTRIVFVLGHGSTSLNNPHESAHDCGACGGAAGGPNARAVAWMLNDPAIRGELAQRGLNIPAETIFVGGVHNTCDESLKLFDVHCVPPSHELEFQEARRQLEAACDRNAHERCRRFDSADTSLTAAAARRHVERRSQDLAETRPEYGHATNSVCIVGRRQRTQGLFLDRRSFLVSYDSQQDSADSAILTRVLQAVVPVCGGISLEYYFSYVDPTGWGCGTKLPHNITSMLGVMDGAASDLRSGLPWQMVEIHEPVRLLFVLEARPEAVLGILQRQPAIAQLVRNRWVQLATLDPDSSTLHVFRDGRFVEHSPGIAELPRATTSLNWYGGLRDHLGYARIEPARQVDTAPSENGQ